MTAPKGPSPPHPAVPEARLKLGWVLAELHADGLIGRAHFDQLVYAAQRSAAEETHPLVVISEQGWTSPASPPVKLDLEHLTRWLAEKVGLPYLRIDPLKIDVGVVTEVVSLAYASRFHFLPVGVRNGRLTVATAEPFVTRWIDELARILRMEVDRVVTNPLDVARYRDEFFIECPERQRHLLLHHNEFASEERCRGG